MGTPNETFAIKLSRPVDAAISVEGATGTIINDDDGTRLVISHLNAQKAEGSNSSITPYTFTVNREVVVPSSFMLPRSASWSVSGFPAGSGAISASVSDFVGGVFPAGTVSLAAGETSKTITINVNADLAVESNEEFQITLFDPSFGAAGTSGKILNDDGTSLAITPANNTGIIKAEGSGGGITAFDFTVTRTGNTAASSSATWAVSGTGAAPATAADFAGAIFPSGIVSFAAGERTKTIRVNVNADMSAESNEQFRVTLSNAIGGTITTAVAPCTIANDDAALPTITLAVAPASTAEDGVGNLVYTFTRTGATASALAVNYTLGGTASLGTDYSGIATAGTTKQVTFAAGSSTATVIVNPTADTAVEANESVVLTLATGTGYVIGTPTAVTGTISNDDDGTRLGFMAPTFQTENAEGGNGSSTPDTFIVTREVIVPSGVTLARTATWPVAGFSGIPASPSDFLGGIFPTGTVSLAAGETRKTITINVNADLSVVSSDPSVGKSGAAVSSESTDDFLGCRMCGAGDIHRDGCDDLLIGAKGDEWDRPTASETRKDDVVYGESSGSPLGRSTIASGSGGFVIANESNDAQAGFSLANFCDLTGTSLADLRIGQAHSSPSAAF